MEVRLAADLQTDSIVDGEGLRIVLWTQGCSHRCTGCHNPQTHSFSGGVSVPIEMVCDEIKNLTYHTGITFSGGDPMFQPEACNEIAKFAKNLGLDIWVYTGFTFEQLLVLSQNNKEYKEFLQNIDVLVDGKFEIEKRNLDLLFRGSENQRLIDVKSSLKSNKVITLDESRFVDTYEIERKGVFV